MFSTSIKILCCLMFCCLQNAQLADPHNATYVTFEGINFNISQYYFRDYLLKNVPTNKCYEYIKNIPFVHYYVDEFDLPDSIIEYKFDTKGNISPNKIVDRIKIINILEKTVNFIFNKIKIKSKKINNYKIYRYEKIFSVLKPIKINFKTSPYSQSNFREFVSDRNIIWETPHLNVYNPRSFKKIVDFYKKNIAGKKSDLLYRFSHNLVHSLGIGHAVSDECIMHAGNILGLDNFCLKEITFLHKFLCDPNLIFLKHQ